MYVRTLLAHSTIYYLHVSVYTYTACTWYCLHGGVRLYVRTLLAALSMWWCTFLCTYSLRYLSCYFSESVPGLGYNTNSRKSSKSYFSCPFSNNKKISHSKYNLMNRVNVKKSPNFHLSFVIFLHKLRTINKKKIVGWFFLHQIFPNPHFQYYCTTN